MRNTTRTDRAVRSRPPTLDEERVRAVLDQEQRLVSEAILLVSRGGSRRVTVAGLQNPETIIEASRARAADCRVRLVELWTDDERGVDVAVEAIEGYATVAQPRSVEPLRPVATIRAAARGA